MTWEIIFASTVYVYMCIHHTENGIFWCFLIWLKLNLLKLLFGNRKSPEEFLTKFAKGKEVKESQPGGHGFTEVAKKSKKTISEDAVAFTPHKVMNF